MEDPPAGLGRGNSEWEYRVRYTRPQWSRRSDGSRRIKTKTFTRWAYVEKYLKGIIELGGAWISVDRAQRGPWENFQPFGIGPRLDTLKPEIDARQPYSQLEAKSSKALDPARRARGRKAPFKSAESD